MKILFRTLIILAAALAVVAGLNAFAQSSMGQAMRSAGPGGMGREGGPPPGFADQSSDGAPASFSGRGEHEGRAPSLAGLVEVGKNLAIVAVSVTLIALGARLLQLGRRDTLRPAPPEQSAPR